MPQHLPSPATPAVRLRPWRHDDAEAIAAMTADTHVRRWSSMGQDVAGWIARQRAEARGPSWAIRPGDAPVGELSYWLLAVFVLTIVREPVRAGRLGP